MERFTATVVLALGSLVLIATVVSVTLDLWETQGRVAGGSFTLRLPQIPA